MITEIEIENFKSFEKVHLKLGGLNLFIGANASGKSNFFDALRVLQGIAIYLRGGSHQHLSLIAQCCLQYCLCTHDICLNRMHGTLNNQLYTYRRRQMDDRISF